MLIALASCASLPDWETDDHRLHEALANRGVEVATPAWDDDTFNWSRCDACLIRTTWDYQQRLGQFLVWLDRVAKMTRLFNPLPIVRWNTHKSYLRDLASRGVPVTPTVWLEPGSQIDLTRVLADRAWRKAFLKPAIGATARETVRFDATPEGIAAAEAHLDRMLRQETMLLQPYLDTVETHGEVSAVFFDGTFSHGVRKIPVPGDYRVQNDFGASDEPWSFTDDELALARRCIDAVARRCLDSSPPIESGTTIEPAKGMEQVAPAEAVAPDDVAPLPYARVDFLRDHQGQLRLSELELVEPSLFFRHAPDAAETLAEALLTRVHDAKRVS